MKSVIPDSILSTLQQATTKMFESVPHFDDTRSVKTYHLGFWRAYASHIDWTQDSRSEKAQQWLRDNASLFQLMNTICKEKFPELFLSYECLSKKLPEQPMGVFPTVAVNKGPCSPHKDEKDYRDGLCFVLPFGDFTGAELAIKEMKIEIQLRPGDLVAFKSHLLTHWNKPMQGTRYSLFFAHDNMFYDAVTK